MSLRHTSRRVRFPSRRGHILVGRAVAPADAPVLAWCLLVHCFTCGKDLKGYHHLARSLSEAGLASLRFDLTGLGESGGQFAASDLDTNVADILDAAAHLDADGARPRLVIGHSLGGIAALLATAQLPAVRALALIGVPSDLRHLLDAVPAIRQAERTGVPVRTTLGGNSVLVGPALARSLTRLDLAAAVAAVGRPLLLVHGSADEIVSREHLDRLAQWAHAPCDSVTLDGADHLLSEPSRATAAGRRIASWAAPLLGPARAT